jgi:hypothetical protein
MMIFEPVRILFTSDKNKYLYLIYIYLLFAACARPVTPIGGPKDNIPPRIIRTWPENGALQFSGNQIVFQFSEYVESANLAKDVFITPIPTVPPEMIFRGKKLFIIFKEALKEQTTYVIQPGKGIRDVNEKNPLDSLFQFAFSTGSWLDSMELSGTVIDPLSGTGKAGVSILLFRKDSIKGDSIFKVRPAYAGQTEEDGSFTLKYLSSGIYKVYGVKEESPNFEYNSTKEALALTTDSEVNPEDTLTARNLTFFLSLPDLDKPKLRNKVWLTQYLLELEWNEAIREFSESPGSSVSITDTFNNSVNAVYHLEKVAGSPEKMRIYLKEVVTEPVRVHLSSICDTLLTCMDTSITIQPRKQIAKFPFRLQPVSEPLYQDSLILLCTEPISKDLPDTAFVGIDTAGNKQALPFVSEGRTIRIDMSALRTKKISWTIQSDSMTLAGYSGTRADTVMRFTWNIPDKADYGDISGTLKDSLDKPMVNPILKIRHKDSGKVWYQAGNRFEFKGIRPGELEIFWFEDLDCNGRWTPGSLFPYRLPERGFPIKGIPKIRAGWELEDVKTEVVK